MILTQSLLEEVKGFILRNELTQVGPIADEHGPAAQQALSGAVPLAVSSLIELSEQVSGREVVWSMAQEAAKSGVLSNPHRSLYATKAISERGAKLVSSVLGERYESGLQSITTATGVKPLSIVNLLNIVVPVALGILGEQAAEHNWSAEALSQWLRSQQGQQAPLAVPLFVTPGAGAGAAPLSARQRSAEKTSRWLWSALVVSSCGIGYLLGYQTQLEAPSLDPQPVSAVRYDAPASDPEGPWDAVNPAAIAANGNYSTANGSYIYDRSGVPVVLKLHSGIRQIIGANSTENKLYQFLANPTAQVNTTDRSKNWITFDRIYFESNKAVLTPESMWQLSNIASILKTFPLAKVQVGGYTDSTGNRLLNQRLSEARAKAARATLLKFGVDSSSVKAAGYGAQHSIASNQTEDGRALNRRVSIRVTEK